MRAERLGPLPPPKMGGEAWGLAAKSRPVGLGALSASLVKIFVCTAVGMVASITSLVQEFYTHSHFIHPFAACFSQRHRRDNGSDLTVGACFITPSYGRNELLLYDFSSILIDGTCPPGPFSRRGCIVGSGD